MNIDEKSPDSDIIGETFAMLCGGKGSPNLICYGKNVFESAVKQYKSAVESINFAD